MGGRGQSVELWGGSVCRVMGGQSVELWGVSL